MDPKISIIVPIYKVEEYLHKCIDSILAQTFTDFELILVDDGSPDNCGKICDEYAKKDKRIRVIHKKNGGVSSARNRGIYRAKGTYIGFIDPDDEIEPNMYKELFKYTYNNSVDMVVCKINTINYNTNTRNESKVWKDANCVIEKNIINQQMIPAILNHNTYSIMSSCNKLYKNENFNSFNIRFDEKIHHGEDARMNLTMLRKVDKIVFVDKPLYNYYIRKRESLTQKFRKDLYNYILDSFIFGVDMCKEYNVENLIDNHINVYISSTINYMQDTLNSTISDSEKYEILSKIVNDKTFNEFVNYYKAPSFYYKLLKYICVYKNIKLLYIMVKVKNKIRNK